MKQALMPKPVQYLVREDGQRTGVVLSWEDYQQLRGTFTYDPDLLPHFDDAELRVLAEGMLATQYQQRLNDLLRRNRAKQLADSEERELDRLLERVDLMNRLKARAMYTLQRRRAETEKREVI